MEKLDEQVKSRGFAKGIKEGIPIALGYIPVSMACGVAASKIGIGFVISQLMSMFMYTASGQLAAFTLFSGGETAVVMYALTLFVMNCRYILFSMSISQRFDNSMGTLQRIGFGLLNTDEVYGIAMKNKGKLGFAYLMGLATISYIGFAVGNVLGAFATSLVPASVGSALGIIVYTMFISIIVPPAKESKPVLVVVIMALVASFILECVPVVKQHLSSGWVIIICAVVTSLIGAWLFPVEEKEDE